MRIVLWVGNEPNQIALANKIFNIFPGIAIVAESRKHKRKITLNKVIEKVYEKLLLKEIAGSWFGMRNFYMKQFPKFPPVPTLHVENINSEEVYNFTSAFNPDLVMVSGTRMVRKKLLSLQPGYGIINLHTGLSPYIKGGPNCTNWCLANGEFEYIGNTIMWIDEGIDSGNLIATECTEFTGYENLTDIHIKVMEHAHDLYLRAVKAIFLGNANNIPQDSIAQGMTFYNKSWGLKEKTRLVKNLKLFKTHFSNRQKYEKAKNIVTVSLID